MSGQNVIVYISREGGEVGDLQGLVDEREVELDWVGSLNGADVPIKVRLAEPEPEDSRMVPDFSMDVAGEYGGNAYPEQREYEVRLAHDPADGIQMLVTDSGGAFVAEPLVITEELADGITSMATTNHDLDGYRDDWALPDGMGRSLSWMLQTDLEVTIELGEHQIEQIADWLDYATGAKTWDWVSDGEEWNH